MKLFWSNERNRLLIFIFFIITLTAFLLLLFFENSMQATQDTFIQTQTSQYEDEGSAYYYGNYSIQYQPGQAVTSPLVIGLCLDDMKSGVQSAIAREIVEYAREKSIRVIVLDSARDPQREFYNITELTLRKVKTIVWSPISKNSSAYKEYTKIPTNITQEELTYKIKKANIPLININHRVDMRVTDLIDSFIAADEDEYLKLAATAILQQLNDNGLSDVTILSSAEYPILDEASVSTLRTALGAPIPVRLLEAPKEDDFSNIKSCIFLTDPAHLQNALNLNHKYGCPIVSGYMDRTIAQYILEGQISSAISASPAAIAKNAILFADNLILGEKAPISVNNVLYLVDSTNISNSADTWYLNYE